MKSYNISLGLTKRETYIYRYNLRALETEWSTNLVQCDLLTESFPSWHRRCVSSDICTMKVSYHVRFNQFTQANYFLASTFKNRLLTHFQFTYCLRILFLLGVFLIRLVSVARPYTPCYSVFNVCPKHYCCFPMFFYINF